MPLNSAEDVVKFDLSESVGVVLESSGVSASAARTSSLHGQLLSLTSQGLLKPALSGTSARIHEIYAAPNNKLYVAFDERVKIESTTCILVEVDEASSAASCVDPDLMSVTWKNPVYKNSNSNPPIQVGRDGSIVYQGATQNRGVLRRKRNGKVSDILAIGGALELGDFLLASDGSVVQSLSTYVKTKCGGITRVLLEGQLDTLSRCERALFIYEMPDGKVWMAINDPEFDYAHEVRTSYGIRRFDLLSNSWVSEAVDALGQRKYFLNSNIQQFQYPQICDTSTLRPWIGQYNGERLEPDQRSAFWANYGFCSSAGGGVSKFFRVGANMVFALSGRLMRYYPTIAVVNSSVRLVSHSFAKDDLFFLSGKDSDFNHITTVYSAATDTESIVSELSGQFEIVRIGGSGATGTVYFQGRRLRDNQLVNGTINLLSMEVKILASQSSEWSNIQVFG